MNLASIEPVLRALETRFIADSAVLHFADGSTREICGRGDYLLSLMLGACGDNNPRQAAQLNLIRQSVAAQAPGGGHMVELLRSLLTGPAGDPRSR